MELIYDWRSFQSVFFPRRQKREAVAEAVAGPVYFITDQDLVIAAYADNEDLGEWVGAPVDEVLNHFEGRACRFFAREHVDQALSKASGLPHFYEQMRVIQHDAQLFVNRGRGKKDARLAKGAPPEPQHFLLEAIQGWWAKMLPSAYGVFLRISPSDGSATRAGDGAQDFLMIVRRGEIDAFLMPDFTTLNPERRERKDQLIRYLSERHMIPVQGVFVTVDEWMSWTRDGDPWKEIAASVRADHEKLHPFKWSLVTMIATRAYFGV